MNYTEIEEINKRIAHNNKQHDAAVARKELFRETLERRVSEINNKMGLDLDVNDPDLAERVSALIAEEAAKIDKQAALAAQVLDLTEKGDVVGATELLKGESEVVEAKAAPVAVKAEPVVVNTPSEGVPVTEALSAPAEESTLTLDGQLSFDFNSDEESETEEAPANDMEALLNDLSSLDEIDSIIQNSDFNPTKNRAEATKVVKPRSTGTIDLSGIDLS